MMTKAEIIQEFLLSFHYSTLKEIVKAYIENERKSIFRSIKKGESIYSDLGALAIIAERNGEIEGVLKFFSFIEKYPELNL